MSCDTMIGWAISKSWVGESLLTTIFLFIDHQLRRNAQGTIYFELIVVQHVHVLDLLIILDFRGNLKSAPCVRTSWPHSLVKAHGHRVQWIDTSIKCCLEISMCSQALLDETAAAALGPKSKRAKPLHISRTEKHVSNGNDSLVYLVRMTCQNDSLHYNATCRRWEHSPCRN